MATHAPDAMKMRFYKFWQAIQLTDGLTGNEAAPLALKQAQSDAKEPDFFRGDVSATLIDDLDPTSAVDLEKAVLAFRDPFLLNRAFMIEASPPEQETCLDGAQNMDVDLVADANAGSIPSIDLPRWKKWLQEVEQFKGVNGDACKDAHPTPSFLERLLESFGDLSSAIEKSFSSKRQKPDSNSSSATQSEDRSGYPDIPPSFLDSPRGLRFLILILFYPTLADPDSYSTWHRALRVFRILSTSQRNLLAAWFADSKNICLDEFQQILQNLQQLITITFLEEFASSDMPEDAMADADNIPDQLWDFFVMRTAQKCKNALSCIDILWKANIKKREALKVWRKSVLVKGAAAMVKDTGSMQAPQTLKEEEFFNDALNSVERVLHHDYVYAMFFEHIERDSNPFAMHQNRKRPQKPKSLTEIQCKAMLNNYTFGLMAYSFCLDACNKCRFLMFDATSRQRENTTCF
eukprot:TRINITY_DN9630_c0_g2_i1.p1 TRINITY_DN9630_c0_g2~~TRINITY_DN9630_c0_g2_i1.p1  ORF type:complete len:463 (-),score=92.28 TRINITY_DN9630_c0_g2_i1:225-1613(-)